MLKQKLKFFISERILKGFSFFVIVLCFILSPIIQANSTILGPDHHSTKLNNDKSSSENQQKQNSAFEPANTNFTTDTISDPPSYDKSKSLGVQKITPEKAISRVLVKKGQLEDVKDDLISGVLTIQSAGSKFD